MYHLPWANKRLHKIILLLISDLDLSRVVRGDCPDDCPATCFVFDNEGANSKPLSKDKLRA